jgi:steroid delta-isomerase-like uncharacterized protein
LLDVLDMIVRIPYDFGTTTVLPTNEPEGTDSTMGMTPAQMDELIERHLAAEAAGDVEGAIAVYTDDVVHDVVGSPTGPVTGKEGARGFYEYLTANVAVEAMETQRAYYTDDACIIEHVCTGTVPGEFLGIPGNGRRITFRLIHVFDFRDGLISRENVWLDGNAVVAQLTAPELAGAAS